MIDYTKLSLAEVKQMAVARGFSIDKSMKKVDIVELLEKNVIRESPDFSSVEAETNDDLESITEEVKIIPKIGSPAWQNYVLSHLVDGEYHEKEGIKYPKASGLRRVTQVLIGPIIKSGPSNIWTDLQNKRSTVQYSVSILWKAECPDWIKDEDIANIASAVREFSEVADCTAENTPSPYNLHPSATAASKAEGRTFKKILQLNVTTAEEVIGVKEQETFDSTNFETDKITDTQKSVINTLSGRLGIDINKMLEFYEIRKELNALTKAEAARMVVELNKYQTKTNGSLEIPDTIKLSLV